MKNFIILSSCGWGEMLQRPHQLARSLYKLGHEVNYIMPTTLGFRLEDKFQGNTTKYSITNKENFLDINIYRNVSIIGDRDVRIESTVNLIESLLSSSKNESVIIQYFPHQYSILKEVKKPFHWIYDCVDDHMDLTNSYWSSPADIEYEIKTMENANSILTTSSSLYLQKSFNRDNVYLIKNAVNIEDFVGKVIEPDDLKLIPKPRICYVGAVDKWFDENLFYEMIKFNPDKSFVVIGPVKEGILKESFDNLHLLGVKNHSELKNYLKYMDVGLIPFKDDQDIIIHCDPIKMYEYIASDLPVVGTRMPEIMINRSFVQVSKDKNEFHDNINSYLKYEYDEVEKREFLNENTWDKRAKDIEDIINNNYNKQKLVQIQELQISWKIYLEFGHYPIIQALYSLTFRETDPNKYLKHSKAAYQNLKTNFIIKNYAEALVLNNELNEGVDLLLQNNLFSDISKAEVLAFQLLNDNKLLKMKILFLIQNYTDFLSILEKFESGNIIKNFEKANYLFKLNDFAAALKIYQTLLDTTISSFSPLYNENLSKLFSNYGFLYESQKFHFKSMNLTDHYLNREKRIDRWSSIFTEPVSSCDFCGGTDFEILLQRPDQQNIIKCKTCELSFLSKFPSVGNLKNLYDFGYYGGSDIGGYSHDYNHEDKGYMFIPRLEWVENTTLNKENKKILDIGCSNGDFLLFSKKLGWDPYGVEISIEGYREAKSKGINVVNSQLIDAKFANDTFDAVTLWDVVEHYVSPMKELEEIYRIIKPNGKLFISTPNLLKGLKMGKNWFGFNASYEHLFYFEPNTLINILTKIGFKIEDCITHESNDMSFNNVKGTGHVMLLSARK